MLVAHETAVEVVAECGANPSARQRLIVRDHDADDALGCDGHATRAGSLPPGPSRENGKRICTVSPSPPSRKLNAWPAP